MPSPIVTLLADFGHIDPYVGVMRGVMLSIAPDVRFVDLTHAVPPQSVLQGVFLLETAWRYFPKGTVHLAVVDPGVGTSRRRLALWAEGQTFVGPDNGLLSSALPDAIRGRRLPGEPYIARPVKLPGGIEAVAIDPSRFEAHRGRGDISATFEGRDVFSPAAALLASGIALDELGAKLDMVEAFPAFQAPHDVQNGLEGVVLHIDTYGNVITDISGDDLRLGAVIEAAGRRLSLVRTYGDASGLCAIVGSSGFVEIALPGGSVAAALGLGVGATVQAVG